MNLKYLIFFACSAAVLVIDQATKIYIDRTMDLYGSIAVIPNVFNITYLRNKGAAFGFLATTSLPSSLFHPRLTGCHGGNCRGLWRSSGRTRSSPPSALRSFFPARWVISSTGCGSGR